MTILSGLVILAVGIYALNAILIAVEAGYDLWGRFALGCLQGLGGGTIRAMELSHGAPLAILISSLFFTVLHLTKGWALAGMIPIIFGAGILLGALAWSSGSLISCMIGHTIMDVGLFGYWWTGIAGEFTLRPIRETGVDRAFVIACVAACAMLTVTLLAIWRLRSLRQNV